MTLTTNNVAVWLREACRVNDITDEPNVQAFVNAASCRKHGLDDNDGCITDENQQALFACLMADDPTLWCDCHLEGYCRGCVAAATEADWQAACERELRAEADAILAAGKAEWLHSIRLANIVKHTSAHLYDLADQKRLFDAEAAMYLEERAEEATSAAWHLERDARTDHNAAIARAAKVVRG